MTTVTPNAAELVAARLLLDRMGLTPQDLLSVPESRPTIPTFAEYVLTVYAAMPDTTTRDAYATYLNRIAEMWPDRRLDEPTATEFRTLLAELIKDRKIRRSDIGGKGTAWKAVAAIRKMYEFAVEDGYIDPSRNPAKKLSRPRMPPSRRRALSQRQLTAINRAAAHAVDDPELATLILRLHTETACRLGGALALRKIDLDTSNCLIRLREKGDLERWQPISRILMRELQHHYSSRKPHHSLAGTKTRSGTLITAEADQRLLRYRSGSPITRYFYEGLFKALGFELPWVVTHGISIHWFRHTTLTWVERRFGLPVAKAYAGHTGRPHSGETTLVYTTAGLPEVARALAALTGEPHPCATGSGLDLDDWANDPDPTNSSAHHRWPSVGEES